ncbi:MAG: enoyl-CoA hydratase [Actinomycetota bacterium]
MSLVRSEVQDGVGTVTLDDPDRRNTISMEMVPEVIAAMDGLEADDSVGAIVVTGAGKGFCAGAQLGQLEGSGDGSVSDVYEAFLRVARSPLPTIAAINGAAVGAGMNLALCCDVRIASTKAKFITRFLDLGLHPGGGHTWMLRRAIGPQAAAAMLFLEEGIDAVEAERIGLIWKAVEPDDLLPTARTLGARAASYPRPVVEMVKRNLARMATVEEHDEAVAIELTDQLWTLNQPWFAERVAEFQARISKR